MKDRHIGEFCDEHGSSVILGTDCLIYFDLRWGRLSRDYHASKQRARYKKNLKHLYDRMTHYVFRGEVRDVQELTN